MRSKEPVIGAIGTAVPRHRIPQAQVARFVESVLGLDATTARRLRSLYRASGIEHRHTVLADCGRELGSFTVFPNTPDCEPFPRVGRRMALYREHAPLLSVAAVKDCLRALPSLQPQDITHLITVSCTGMYAPGLDLDLVAALGLSNNVQRTCVNFMGCYAAFPALKLAHSICRADPDAVVLVVCTELCSLHIQKKVHGDALLSSALFADGSAAALVSARRWNSAQGLALTAFHGDLAPDGHSDMAWHIGDFGFEMTLSSYVPGLVREGIEALTAGLLAGLGVRLQDIRAFAIHPGGRKILEAIEQALGLTRHDNRHAYSVLRDHGNMSSATVLFVLKRLMDSLSAQDVGQRVLSFGFGPGLTLESMLLTVEAAASPRRVRLPAAHRQSLSTA